MLLLHKFVFCYGLFILLWFEATTALPGQPAQPMNMTQFAGKRVLFSVAHPDDIEGLAGGFVSLLTALPGTEVAYLVMTNGDKGGKCYNSTGPGFYSCSKQELANIRRNEQLAAADYLNVSIVRFFDLEDGMLKDYPERALRVKLTAFIRTFKPHFIFTFFIHPNFACPPMNSAQPYGWGDLGYHPDHQQSGLLTLDTISSFAPSLALEFDELTDAGIDPWTGMEGFYMFALTSDQMTHYVDIGGDAMIKKNTAFLHHKSQVEGDNDTVITNTEWVAQQIAHNSGASSVQYAEGYTSYF